MLSKHQYEHLEPRIVAQLQRQHDDDRDRDRDH
jgi:hypothetical protein